MSGFPGDLNDDQKKTLEEFKTRLTNDKNDLRTKLGLTEDNNNNKHVVLWTVDMEEDSAQRDIVCLKFLRARDFKLEQSYEMFKKCLAWRKEFNIESLSSEQFPDYYAKIGEIYRTDKEGRPVMFNYYCNIDVDTVFKDGVTQFLRWKVAQMESAIAQLAAGGWSQENMVVVHDYKDVSMLGMDKRTKQASRETIQLLQDNYPEMLARKFFINVPWFFEKLYGFFTAFSNERTRKKFIVCGNKTYRKELLQFIDAESLPTKYGGMSTEESNKIECAIIKAKDALRVDLGELQSEQMIEWEFICESMDIGFGIEKAANPAPSSPTSSSDTPTSPGKSRKQAAGNVTVLDIAQHEYNAGSYKVDEAGRYIFVLDNTYSIFNKKSVHYRVAVKEHDSNPVAPAAAPSTTSTTTTTTQSSDPAPSTTTIPETSTTTTTTTAADAAETTTSNQTKEETTTVPSSTPAEATTEPTTTEAPTSEVPSATVTEEVPKTEEETKSEQ
ncbi:hypothetical protein SAMD00019534_122600 [Acytostelium subglobosum LB1]|uniref:hypothetical protein n=1 Tax=Acytostelium subglobosum LB1 TaxID=1410327 RepID=UPI00064517D7|nr:hypothetical protein SAMD00019534_122600 [Acytostelium subglobosum LB1]GAM29084.1 hypothetical protein SAMD00019534_122600 [Acytostelium subglobosum LB1]|eukprot:XP_012747929.1 hypothetical protein SAMD00019534_122600 [Acytostelium subglobosum LB1]